MNIAEIKKIMGIDTYKHDDYLDVVVPMFVEYAQEKTNNLFLDFDGNERLPGPVKVFVAKACEYNMGQAGLKSRSSGEVSYSYDTDLPASITKLLKPYKKVRF